MNIYLNGERRELPRRKEMSIHDMLNHLSVTTPNERVDVSINGKQISTNQWLKHGVNQGDRVEINLHHVHSAGTRLKSL